MKSGCAIKRHSLRTAPRAEPQIGLISVATVRLRLMRTATRHEPEAKTRYQVLGLWLKALLLIKPKLAQQELTMYKFPGEVEKLGDFIA